MFVRCYYFFKKKVGENMTFGENLRNTREKLGLSQRALGERLGVTQQTIAQYEKAVEQPKLKTVRRLADALDVPLYKLVTDWQEFNQKELLEDFTNDSHVITEEINIDDLENSTNELLEKLNNSYVSIRLSYKVLNTAGKKKLAEYAEDLTKIPEYRADTAPDPTLAPPNPPDPQQKKD